MTTTMGLEHYDVKILLALNQCIAGRKDFFRWLLDNGYPELAAFSNAIRGDVAAMEWLAKNGYRWLAIMSNAIDGDDPSRVWIGKSMHECNLRFALACREDLDSIRWLMKHDLQIFLMLAKEVKTVLEVQALENTGPYVMHF